jgi:hypothetical protein
MKHYPLILLTFALASCGATTTPASFPASSEPVAPYTLDINVATPAGAPAVGLYRHLSSDKLEVNADPANVVAYMNASSGKDIVILPTNAGLTAIAKKGAPYKIAATVTFGNFYLASTGHDDDSLLDADDYVVLFQQGNVPDKLFQYVYGDMNLTNTHYVNAASDAQRCLITAKDETNDNADVDYVLIAEPAFTAAKKQNENISEYASIQTEFSKKSSGASIAQASVFVANSADVTKVNSFLSALKTDIEAFLATPAVLDEATAGLEPSFVQSKLGAPAAMLKTMASANNRMGLGYKAAKDNKASIDAFMKLFGFAEGIDAEAIYR